MHMRNVNKLLLVAGLGITVAGSLTGCQQFKEHEARKTGRTAAQYESDAMTDRRVRDALYNSPIYKFRSVGVNTFNGVVQLNGFVDTANQKQAAGDITRTVPGVDKIVNNIAVKSDVAPTGRGPAPIYESQHDRVPQPNPAAGQLPPNQQPLYQGSQQNPPAYQQNPPPENQNTNTTNSGS